MEVMSRAQDPLDAQISSGYMPRLHKSPYPVVDAIKKENLKASALRLLIGFMSHAMCRIVSKFRFRMIFDLFIQLPLTKKLKKTSGFGNPLSYQVKQAATDNNADNSG